MKAVVKLERGFYIFPLLNIIDIIGRKNAGKIGLEEAAVRLYDVFHLGSRLFYR